MKRTVLITGATSGIGEACARKFAQSGYRLIITGRNAEKLAFLKSELEDSGAEVRILVFDVRDAAAAENAIASLSLPDSVTSATAANPVRTEISSDPASTADPSDPRTVTTASASVLDTTAPFALQSRTRDSDTTAPSALQPRTRDSDTTAPFALQSRTRDSDTTAPSALQSRTRDTVPADWQKIDVLINNAGLALGLEKEYEGNPEDWGTMIDTNIKGLLTMTRLIVPGMVERNCGHVINIGSVAGDAAYAGGNVYCATKAAVKTITDGLRIDLADTAVRVTNIKPGLVETNFSCVRFKGDKARASKVYEGIKPLTGNDIADVALYAASAPAHVQIAEVLVLATHQANGSVVARK